MFNASLSRELYSGLIMSSDIPDRLSYFLPMLLYRLFGYIRLLPAAALTETVRDVRIVRGCHCRIHPPMKVRLPLQRVTPHYTLFLAENVESITA